MYSRSMRKLIYDKAKGIAMTSREQLHAWIARHMPELHAELKPMPMPHQRIRLNALTGAQVRSCDTIEDGSARFLAALQDLTGEA